MTAQVVSGTAGAQSRGMRHSALGFLLLSLALGGCGGSVSQDGSASGGSSGAGAQAGSGGGGSGGAGAVGGSAGTGAVGGMGGAAGTAGAGGWPGCCASDNDCPQYLEDGLSTECINGVCKEVPPKGQCWDNADCGSGICNGGSVCPCMADCFAADTLGYCSNEPGCCSASWQCPNGTTCAQGNCMPLPPMGQCWSDADCPMGGSCQGASFCPCGYDCGGMEKLGWCAQPPPPPQPGGCCKADWECGDESYSPCVSGVCKAPAPAGQCWKDAECPTGQKCIGASVCPCGALCGIADMPGKCG